MERTYRVSGMSCGHCVGSVTEAVGAVPGVDRVDVDLARGLVTVTGGAVVDDDAVRRAVDDAGYEMTS